MSEFLAEARILVRPDTTGFRAELEAALAAATAKPITIPVVAAVASTTNAAAAAAAASQAAAQTSVAAAAQEAGAAVANAAAADVKLAAASTKATVSVGALSVAMEAEAASSRALNLAMNGLLVDTQAVVAATESETAAVAGATVAQRAHSLAMGQATRGVIAQGASMLGLRAGTLAASSAFIGGTVAVLAFARSVQSAAKLQTELNVFQATAGATADQMARVSDEAKALGRDLTLPGVTANDAAVALTELSKAGLSVQDSLDGARGALQLATAAQIDNVTATKLVAGALNAFNLSGTESVRVADLLTGAAKESQGEIGDMGTALSQVASVSQQFGVTIGDTVTLLTELAQAGLSGGRAGTSLRVAFLRLVNPTAAAAKELDKLNIAVRDANGNLRPGVFTDITDALQGYSKAQRDAALATIFGSDAIRSAAIIGNKGANAFLQTSAAVNEVGLAQEQAAARTKGLQGDTENLKNQVSSLGLTLGQVATGPVSLLVKGLAGIASEANAAAQGLIGVGKVIGDVGGKIGGSIPFLDRFEKHLGTIAKEGLLVVPLAGTLVAVGEGAKLLGLNSDNAKPKTDAFGNSIDDISSSLGDLSKNLLQSAADSKIFSQQVTTDTAKLLQSAADSRIGTNLNKALPPPPQFPVERIQNMVQGFSDKQLRDRINHNNAALLADLKAEQAFLVKELQRQGVQNRPALRRALESALGGVVNEIDAINAKAQAALKASKDKAAKDARDAAALVRKREQDLLSSQGLARDRAANKLAADQAKGNIAAQIKDENALARLVKDQIAAVKKRISAAGGQAAALVALRAIQIAVGKAQQDLIKQQNADKIKQRSDLLTGIGLDISLDQIQQNQGKEVADRRRLIAQLNKDLQAEAKLHGTTTVAYKEIRNQIAEQNAAIAAITAEKKKQNGALGTAEFEFLQAQQGFASNLLGNLIPSGATAGLVGGRSVQQSLPPLTNAAAAAGKSGPTSGQAQSTNAILARILDQLKILNGGQAAPEANWQANRSIAWLDGVVGG